MNTARSGAKRRKMALAAEVERLDKLEKAFDFEDERLRLAIQGEELPTPKTLDEAKERARARFDFILADDEFHNTPELRDEYENIRLRDATIEAEREAVGDLYDSLPYGNGDGLTSVLEANLPRGEAS